MMIGKTRFRDDVSVAIKQEENGGLSFHIQEYDVDFQFNESYAFGMARERDFLLAWCASKFIAFDFNTSQLYQNTENDFISDAFIEDDLFLVCDTTIVVKEIRSWHTKRIDGHPEIIAANELNRKNKALTITDICGKKFIYNLASGTIA